MLLFLSKASYKVGTPTITLGSYFFNNLSKVLAENCGIKIEVPPKY